mmetsp:Transcript_8250/g.51377  ORF Transcript_8250/g.51377 Transcript_8250/m.51377 type:complete len:276 (+) Transcript_8250:68-895(+)
MHQWIGPCSTPAQNNELSRHRSGTEEEQAQPLPPLFHKALEGPGDIAQRGFPCLAHGFCPLLTLLPELAGKLVSPVVDHAALFLAVPLRCPVLSLHFCLALVLLCLLSLRKTRSFFSGLLFLFLNFGGLFVHPSDLIWIHDNRRRWRFIKQLLNFGFLLLLFSLVRICNKRIKVGLSSTGHKNGGNPSIVPGCQYILVRAKPYLSSLASKNPVRHVRRFLLGGEGILPDLEVPASSNGKEAALRNIHCGCWMSREVGMQWLESPHIPNPHLAVCT